MKDADHYLQILNPTELLAFLKNLELGDDHLKNILTKCEYEELLSLKHLESNVFFKMKADQPELIGKISSISNSVLTAILGLYMGLSGLLGESLPPLFRSIGVLIFAPIAGGFIGFKNYKFTKKLGEASIRKRKLQALQMDILNHLKKERIQEIEKKTEEINTTLQTLPIKKTEGSSFFQFNNQKSTLACLNNLNVILDNHALFYKDNSVYQVFSQEIGEARQWLAENLEEHPKKEKGEMLSQEEKRQERFSAFFKKLIKIEEKRTPRPSWIQSNFRNLMISLTPTLLGAFSSSFAYFSGIPKIAQEFEQNKIYEILTTPTMKKFQLFSSLIITIYFTIIFIYLNYKSFVRNREYEEMEKTLIREKDHLRKLDDQLLKIKEIYIHIMRIANIFENLKKLSPLKKS